MKRLSIICAVAVTMFMAIEPSDGNTLIADAWDNRVIEVDSSGTIVWQKTGLHFPIDAERLANGNTLIADYHDLRVIEVDISGTIVWQKGWIIDPGDVERLANGNTLITQTEIGIYRVIEVDSSGLIIWQWAAGRPVDAERLANGNTLIAEYSERVIEVDSSGSIVWQKTGLNSPRDVERLANGNTLITEGLSRVIEVDSSGLIIWQWAGRPYDAERLSNGNTLIAEPTNKRVIEVDSSGTIVWQKTGLNYPLDAERVGPEEPPEPPPGTTLSGVVFDDKNDNGTYNPGEEVSGALISTGEGTPVTSGPNGRYIISELTPPDVWLKVTIDGDDYWAYCHIEDGENQFDIMINSSAEEQFNVCSANVSCATGFAGLLPYVGKAADHVSVALGVCGTKQRLDAGDLLGATIGIVKLTVNFLNTLIEDAVFIITGSAAEAPYQLVDAAEASINCAESQLWEYAYDHCGGYTSCIWEGFMWLGESFVGIFTGSPVDIRVIDSQGNVMELDANGYTKNELSSPGWIFKGPDDKELALIFDADDYYTVLIVGRPEAGASSTFYLQMMQQSAGGSQQIHTYTNVPISAQGVAFAQIGDNPVLEVDVDGDGTVDLNLPTDSLAMQVVPLLPSSDKNKAGRTMPVKFSLRRPERVDPAMPFVYDEDLEIRIYDSADPGTILQTSRHGDTARDYRIDTDDELYITNFRTKKEPAEYIVEIWRTDLSFQVGSFTFQTLK